MKILMLCDFYNSDLEYQENLLTKYYTKHGHDVTVIASTFENVFDYYSGNHDKSVQSRVYYDGSAKIIKLQYSFNILNKLRKYTSISGILKKEKPDLIYVHDIMLNMLEAVDYMKLNPDCKMIMDYHADYSNSGKNWLSLNILHGVLRKWYLDRSKKYISKIFPIVPAGTKFLHEIYKVPLENMEVLPLGADSDLFQEIENSVEILVLKKKYNLDESSKVIITGGKLSPAKMTEIVIKAYIELDIKNLHLIIIGDASKEDINYKRMLLEISSSIKNIHYTGWLNKREVYTHLAISSLAVFPASQSIIWQQAIAAGLPLIVGNIGEQSIEYLNLHNNIITIDKDDIKVIHFKENMKKVLTDDKRYQDMRDGALKVANQELDWNHLIDRTLKYNR